MTPTVVFRGKKHTFPALGPRPMRCPSRVEPVASARGCYDDIQSLPSGRVEGKRRRNVRVIMTGPVDQRVMMVFSLYVGSAKGYRA